MAARVAISPRTAGCRCSARRRRRHRRRAARRSPEPPPALSGAAPVLGARLGHDRRLGSRGGDRRRRALGRRRSRAAGRRRRARRPRARAGPRSRRARRARPSWRRRAWPSTTMRLVLRRRGRDLARARGSGPAGARAARPRTGAWTVCVTVRSFALVFAGAARRVIADLVVDLDGAAGRDRGGADDGGHLAGRCGAAPPATAAEPPPAAAPPAAAPPAELPKPISLATSAIGPRPTGASAANERRTPRSAPRYSRQPSQERMCLRARPDAFTPLS